MEQIGHGDQAFQFQTAEKGLYSLRGVHLVPHMVEGEKGFLPQVQDQLTLLMGQHKRRGDVIVGGKVQKAGENIGIQLWVGDPETDRGVKDQRTGELWLDRADAVQLPAVRQTFYLRDHASE